MNVEDFAFVFEGVPYGEDDLAHGIRRSAALNPNDRLCVPLGTFAAIADRILGLEEVARQNALASPDADTKALEAIQARVRELDAAGDA
jgi:hypothetical protein